MIYQNVGRTTNETKWPHHVSSSMPLDYIYTNTIRFASKLHGTKRMFLRTFWWSYNKIRMTSHMPPYHSWPTITRVFSPKSWNSKNVLKKVLQLTKVSFLSTLAHQATKTKAHELFLERETQLSLSVKLQDISFYKYKHISMLRGEAYIQIFNLSK